MKKLLIAALTFSLSLSSMASTNVAEVIERIQEEASLKTTVHERIEVINSIFEESNVSQEELKSYLRANSSPRDYRAFINALETKDYSAINGLEMFKHAGANFISNPGCQVVLRTTAALVS